MWKLRFISVLVLLLVGIALCNAQSRSNWDEVLDRYEVLCDRCLELMQRQKAGESVPRESLTSLANQLSMLRRTLSDAQGSMSAAQKSRFEMIRRRFGAGPSPAPSHPSPESVSSKPSQSSTLSPRSSASTIASARGNTSGSADTASVSHHPVLSLSSVSMAIPQIAYPAISPNICKPCLAADIQYDRAPSQKSILFALQAGACPTFTFGGLFGYSGERLGAYLKGRSSLSARPQISYEIDSNGAFLSAPSSQVTPSAGSFWSDGTYDRNRVAITAGGLVRISSSRFMLYAGAGYGAYSYSARDIDGNWASVSDLSTSGLTLDLGSFVFVGNHLFAGAGLCCTSFRYSELELSLGYSF